jgi:hypothetical protein
MQDVLHGDSAAGAEVSALPPFSEPLVYGHVSSGVRGLLCVPALGRDVVCIRQHF